MRILGQTLGGQTAKQLVIHKKRNDEWVSGMAVSKQAGRNQKKMIE